MAIPNPRDRERRKRKKLNLPEGVEAPQYSEDRFGNVTEMEKAPTAAPAPTQVVQPDEYGVVRTPQEQRRYASTVEANRIEIAQEAPVVPSGEFERGQRQHDNYMSGEGPSPEDIEYNRQRETIQGQMRKEELAKGLPWGDIESPREREERKWKEQITPREVAAERRAVGDAERDARTASKQKDYEDSGFAGTQEEYFEDKGLRNRFERGKRNMAIHKDMDFEDWVEQDYEYRFQRRADRHTENERIAEEQRILREEFSGKSREERQQREEFKRGETEKGIIGRNLRKEQKRYTEIGIKEMGISGDALQEFVEQQTGGRQHELDLVTKPEEIRAKGLTDVAGIQAETAGKGFEAQKTIEQERFANNLQIGEQELEQGRNAIASNEKIADLNRQFEEKKIDAQTFIGELGVYASERETLNIALAGVWDAVGEGGMTAEQGLVVQQQLTAAWEQSRMKPPVQPRTRRGEEGVQTDVAGNLVDAKGQIITPPEVLPTPEEQADVAEEATFQETGIDLPNTGASIVFESSDQKGDYDYYMGQVDTWGRLADIGGTWNAPEGEQNWQGSWWSGHGEQAVQEMAGILDSMNDFLIYMDDLPEEQIQSIAKELMFNPNLAKMKEQDIAAGGLALFGVGSNIEDAVDGFYDIILNYSQGNFKEASTARKHKEWNEIRETGKISKYITPGISKAPSRQRRTQGRE
jgi:hypothetical protein